MASIARLQVPWTGAAVTGGGVSTFYTTNLSPLAYATALRAFFVSVAAFMPSGVTITVPAAGDLIEDSTGALSGSWSITPPAPVSGATGANYAAGVGARIVWQTSGITRGRRVKGSTYLVPLLASQYDIDGTIAGASVATMSTAAATLAAADSGSMCIWTRPSTSGGSDGHQSDVTSGACLDKTSWLRSRRT